MNLEILKAISETFPQENTITLIEFYQTHPEITFDNYHLVFKYYKENKSKDLKDIQERCKSLNENGVYFKFVSDNRIVFSKLTNFIVSDENLESIRYDIEDICIEKTKIIFHSLHQNPYGLDEEKFKNEKYSMITKEEYERVIQQNLTAMELNFKKYSK